MLQWLGWNTLGTWLHTRRRGAAVGKDEFGNRYYRDAKHRGDWRSERRWVVYAGTPEPSMVPPGWSGWLRHQFEKPPSEQPLLVKPWEKPHLPNRTGTPEAYVPSGHERRGGKREAATGDYEAWRP